MSSAERLYFDLNDEFSGGQSAMDILFKVMVSKENDVVRPRTIRIKGRVLAIFENSHKNFVKST